MADLIDPALIELMQIPMVFGQPVRIVKAGGTAWPCYFCMFSSAYCNQKRNRLSLCAPVIQNSREYLRPWELPKNAPD